LRDENKFSNQRSEVRSFDPSGVQGTIHQCGNFEGAVRGDRDGEIGEIEDETNERDDL
jgi:hypothetical protein